MTRAAKRWIFLSIGWLAVGLGAIGVLLPGIPTVPFLLVALWAFSKSSPKMTAKLLEHPTYGPPLRDWQEKGAISKRGKTMSLLVMGLSVGITAVMTGNMMVVAIQAAILAAVAVYIVTRPLPDRARQEA